MVRVNKPEYNIIYIYIDIQCPSLHLPTGWGEYWWKAIHKALWHQAGDGLLVPAQPYELCESPQVSKWVPVRHVPPNCLQCELVGTPQTESNSGWSNESPISTPMGPMVMTTTVPLPHKQIRTWSWSYTCLCLKKQTWPNHSHGYWVERLQYLSATGVRITCNHGLDNSMSMEFRWKEFSHDTLVNWNMN